VQNETAHFAMEMRGLPIRSENCLGQSAACRYS